MIHGVYFKSQICIMRLMKILYIFLRQIFLLLKKNLIKVFTHFFGDNLSEISSITF